jgi:hypothetical protein
MVTVDIAREYYLTLKGCAFKYNFADITLDDGASVTLGSCWFSGSTPARNWITVVSTINRADVFTTMEIDVEGESASCSFPFMPVSMPDQTEPLPINGGGEADTPPLSTFSDSDAFQHSFPRTAEVETTDFVPA